MSLANLKSPRGGLFTGSLNDVRVWDYEIKPPIYENFIDKKIAYILTLG